MYARIKPLLDKKGILSLTELSPEELIKRAEEYRRRLRDLTGAVKAYPLTSGRAALALALRALGVRPGDEVVIPALTCPAVADAVISIGGIPYLCDVSPRTLSIRPKNLRRVLARKKSRAVIDAPLLGTVPPMGETADICETAGVPLVIDVAQSFGCRREGKALASFGQLAIVSTNVDKPFTTGRGGVLLAMDGNIVPRTDELYLPLETQEREEEMTILKGLAIAYRLFSKENYESFASIDLGLIYSYAEGDAYDLEDLLFGEAGGRAAARAKASAEKLTPVKKNRFWRRLKLRFKPSTAVPDIGPLNKLGSTLSAVGALHLKRFEIEGDRRRELVGVYNREFIGYHAVDPVNWAAKNKDTAWPLRYAVLLNDYRDKESLISRCAGAGYEVGSFVYPRPLSGQFPYFKLSRYAGRRLKGAWRIAAGMVNLPLHSEITPDDVGKIAEAIKG